MPIQHFFPTNIPLFIAFQSSIITALTIINKDALVNDTYFAFKINTINHFLNSRVKLKWDT